MSNELLTAAFLVWLAASLISLTGRGLILVRVLLFSGSAAAIVAAILALPEGTPPVTLPTRLAGAAVSFRIAPDGLWLLGFGLVPASLACWLATPARQGRAGWLFGAAMSLIGALGVFGIRDGAGFLIAYEIMSFGGATMILSEKLSADAGRPVLFMLGLLEVGAIALVVAVLLLAVAGHSFAFEAYGRAADNLATTTLAAVGLLLVIGFGAKLGLLPFYEWFPAAYGAGSGASGALISGVMLNAAYYCLSRGLLEWGPGQNAEIAAALGILVVAVAVLSAVLTALYAFQQDDWRTLLSFSSAENAAIAVAMLGAALIFRGHGMPDLAGLAWTVSLLHLGGHALAKGGLFLTADGVYRATGGYVISQTNLLRRSSWMFGLGALFAAMSLSAMPPQAGFVSEWYMFETFFQGFRLDTLSSRLVMALAGAGLALTVAIAFATYVKAFGLGLLGRSSRDFVPIQRSYGLAVSVLGFGVLALAVGMPIWLDSLQAAVSAEFGTQAASNMHDGLLLVPLTAKFAFISPTMLVVVMPLLSIVPVLLVMTNRRFAVRRVRVWYGGFDYDPSRASTTALTFSNALRTFYSFIYRPTEETTREANGAHYFVRRLVFSHDVAPIFGPYLFAPAIRTVIVLANKLKALQSGHLNFYLGLIGALLIIILALVLY
ncbi:MAG TPA: proton-conducting transporter membrane subunit [Xanthobacteraceae bacterium]|nr:proton-conducting transporter membrane subunit [Xanthobacteraceae bacterium]